MQAERRDSEPTRNSESTATRYGRRWDDITGVGTARGKRQTNPVETTNTNPSTSLQKELAAKALCGLEAAYWLRIYLLAWLSKPRPQKPD